MLTDRFSKLVFVAVAIHAALFFAGYVFMGLEFSLCVAAGWGISWMLYCGAIAAKWDDEIGTYDDKISVLSLALIGGPLCWLLCPTCLIPFYQRKSSGFVALWYIAQKVLGTVKSSILNIMGILHGFCKKEYPASGE